MSHTNIINRSSKLTKFKKLMAHTMATVSLVSPLILVFSLYNLATSLGGYENFISMPTLLRISFAPLIVAQLITFLAKVIEGEDLDKNKFLKYINSKYWKNVLNNPEIIAFKKQSENEIIALRIISEKNILSDSDYEFIASLIKEKKEIVSSYSHWLERMSRDASTTSKYSYEDDNGPDVKMKMFTQDFKLSQIGDSLNEIMNKIDKNKLNSILNTKSDLVAIKGQLDFTSYAKKEVKASIEALNVLNDYNHSVLSHSAFVNLNEKIYKDLNSIISTQNTQQIGNIFAVLQNYDWPKVDWSRLKYFLIQGYTNNDRYYESWMKIINVKVKEQEMISGQKTLEVNLGHEIKSSLNTKINKARVPDIKEEIKNPNESVKYCEYINYVPNFNKESWFELKEHYNAIIESKLSTHLLLEFNSRLNTVLPLIMHSDKVLGKNILLESSQTSAQNLIVQNLTMLIDNAKDLRSQSDASLVQELQAVTNYQKMKTSR